MPRTALKTQIDATIYPNTQGEIDAGEHQQLLRDIIDETLLAEDLAEESSGSVVLDKIGGRMYGTAGSPLTGNLTVSLAGAILGGQAFVTHNDTTEPDLSNAIKDPGFTYATGQINTIVIRNLGSGYVLAYTLRQIQPGGGITSIVQDTSPQLGGNLDLNGKKIGNATESQINHLVGVSTPIQTQLDAKQSLAQKGEPNGYLGLDSNGKASLASLEQAGADDGQAPIWNDTQQRWVPGAVSPGGVNVKIGTASPLPADILEDDYNISWEQDGSNSLLFYPYAGVKLLNKINTTYSILKTDMFGVVKCGATSGNNVQTLPAIQDLPKNAFVWIVNTGHSGGFAVTLSAASGNLISNDADEISSAAQTFSMLSGRCYLLRKPDSGSTWEIALKTWWPAAENTSQQTEQTVSPAGGILTLDASLSLMFTVNTTTNYTVNVNNIDEGQTLTLHAKGTGNITGLTGDFSPSETNFSGGVADWAGVTGLATSNDLIIITRQGSKFFIDLIPQTAL